MITKETKNKIVNLRKKGLTLAVIAKQLGLSTSTVAYHSSADYKKKSIARAIKNQKPRDRREYNRIYQAKRYKNDLEFREKMKKDNRENWQRKNGTK